MSNLAALTEKIILSLIVILGSSGEKSRPKKKETPPKSSSRLRNGTDRRKVGIC